MCQFSCRCIPDRTADASSVCGTFRVKTEMGAGCRQADTERQPPAFLPMNLMLKKENKSRVQIRTHGVILKYVMRQRMGCSIESECLVV